MTGMTGINPNLGKIDVMIKYIKYDQVCKEYVSLIKKEQPVENVEELASHNFKF